ncbi:MAG: DUF692 domain-containing protein [Reyranella sp.]|uniref:MNIO family bufferin maturase n=1 Tax=Reyranella sp. TaxID=1929291 RepID=UPI0011F8CD16|nr:DUF692 domain-containing protein [Reyranella sp.]TAJ87810.1 MAG: DUF692 domain-containing protein [Reyranella sp.]TBR26343.1 MAG: DUF692 domain-containing protein [Reyranella sp.]
MTVDRLPRAGAGLKPEHQRHILEARPDVGWFEVHAENYMGAGGPPHHSLERIRALYPLSVHGVGLSIGSADGMAPGHLARLKTVVDRYQPFTVSEHLAWSTHDGIFLNDLLPLPYTEATLSLVARHVDEVQTTLGRRILIENPSTYLRFDGEEMPETDFLRALARRSGCGLLLDINNVVVSAANHGFDPRAYLASFPHEHVGEIHLAGHAVLEKDGETLLVDTHDRTISLEVWRLFREVIARHGRRPTLIEWDVEVPAWQDVEGEVRQAQSLLQSARGLDARAA